MNLWQIKNVRQCLSECLTFEGIMFDKRRNIEEHGMRNAEHTPARSPVIWWWKMKITSWRYASTTINLTLKEIRLQNFLKTFSEKKVQANIQHGKWVVTTIWLFVWCFPIVANKNLNVRTTTSGHKTWYWWLVSPINWHSSASDEWMMKAASP